MFNENNKSSIPSRILYTMIRVSNLERSIDFYKKSLGMNELRRETFTEGRFTLVFMGYTDDKSNTVIELTHNWDKNHYDHGTAFGHIALEVKNIYTACKHIEKTGSKVIMQPGPMHYAADETGHKEIIAFIEDPDGYKIELIQAA